MTEAHPFGSHHPVDHRAAGLARPQAMPQVLRRRDHQRRRLVFVERAAADQIRTVLLKSTPRASARRCTETSLFSRSITWSGMRAIDPGLGQKAVKYPGKKITRMQSTLI
jgi:hypothetical protein